MNIKTKLYLLSVILALVTVVLTKLARNFYFQAVPFFAIYITTIYFIGNIKSKSFWGLVGFCCLVNAMFQLIAGTGVILTQRQTVGIDGIWSVVLINIVILAILTGIQSLFIYKAIRANKQ